MRLVKWKLAIARGGFIAIAQFCFYLSLIHMEFATASTIAFSGALFVTLLSILILGHRVGIWRWSAVGVGFVGIVMVMRPETDSFNVYALLPVCASRGSLDDAALYAPRVAVGPASRIFHGSIAMAPATAQRQQQRQR